MTTTYEALRGFAPGHRVRVSGSPRPHENGLYLVVRPVWMGLHVQPIHEDGSLRERPELVPTEVACLGLLQVFEAERRGGS